jgi:hypothetical protein
MIRSDHTQLNGAQHFWFKLNFLPIHIPEVQFSAILAGIGAQQLNNNFQSS